MISTRWKRSVMLIVCNTSVLVGFQIKIGVNSPHSSIIFLSEVAVSNCMCLLVCSYLVFLLFVRNSHSIQIFFRVSVVNDHHDDHVKRIAEFAVEAIDTAKSVLIDVDNPDKGYVQIRAGFHSGSKSFD